MTEDIVKKTYTSVSYRIIFQLLQQISVFVLSILLARLLTPMEFGVIALANLVINYANNFTNMGFNNALIQKKEIKTIHINSVFTIDLTVSSILFILTFFGAGSIAGYFGNALLEKVLKWMSLYYVITSFYYIPLVVLRREMDFKFISIQEYIKSILSYIVTLILAWFGYSYWSIVYPTLGLTAIWAVIFSIKARWMPMIKFNHQEMKGVYSFGAWNFVRTQIGLIVSKIDYFVIGKYLNLYELGLYEKSFEMMGQAVGGISIPISSVLFSSFSRLQNEKSTQKLLFEDGLKLLFLLLLPVIFGVIAIAGHFVFALLGNAWAGAIIPIRLLAFASFFRITGGIIVSLNIANGNYRQQTYFEIVSAIVLIAGCFLLIPFGINGIAVAVILFYFVQFQLSLQILKKSFALKFKEIFISMKYPLLASFLMFTVVFILSEYVLIEFKSIVQFVILFLSGASIYLLSIYIFIKTHLFKLNYNIKEMGIRK